MQTRYTKLLEEYNQLTAKIGDEGLEVELCVTSDTVYFKDGREIVLSLDLSEANGLKMFLNRWLNED